ncbi:hypothetical protein [Microcoleus sp.]|uniref:hypothetical protein n=1 Tax=Microcoleus sp. TaxID=44472 RepID=UPI003524DF52
MVCDIEEVGTRGTVTLQDAPGCSTAVVRLLDKQLIEEMNKIEPNCLVSFAELNVYMGEGVHPFLPLPALSSFLFAKVDVASQRQRTRI